MKHHVCWPLCHDTGGKDKNCKSQLTLKQKWLTRNFGCSANLLFLLPLPVPNLFTLSPRSRVIPERLPFMHSLQTANLLFSYFFPLSTYLSSAPHNMLSSDNLGIFIRWYSIPFGYSHKLFKKTVAQHDKNFQQIMREDEGNDRADPPFLS